MLTEITARPLAVARIGIGAAAALRALIGWSLLGEFGPTTVRMPVFDWLPDPASAAARIVVIVWLVGAIGLALGRWTTASGLMVAGGAGTFLVLDHQTYANHLYLIALLAFLLAVADAGAALGGGSERPVLSWPVQLIKAQVILVYAFSAVTKLNDGFLSGEVLAGVLRGGLVDIPASWLTPSVMGPVAILTVVTELALALFLWQPNGRPYAILLGTMLHVAIVLLMGPTGPLIVFSVMMMSTYPLFLSTEPLHVASDATIERIRRRDVMHLVRSHTTEPVSVSSSTLSGADAALAARDRAVPDLWVAGALRLPGIRALARRRIEQ